MNPVTVMREIKENLYSWYNMPELNKKVEECVKAGYFYRPSHTQVEWTKEGAYKVTQYKELYLSYVNDFLTISAFSEYYEMGEKEALEVIEIGKTL